MKGQIIKEIERRGLNLHSIEGYEDSMLDKAVLQTYSPKRDVKLNVDYILAHISLTLSIK